MTQAAVPRDIVHKINRDVVAIVQTPEVKASLRRNSSLRIRRRSSIVSFVTRRRSSPRCSRE
jgi:hypothetical protein